MDPGPEGMDTLVLLARDTPLPKDVDLDKLLSGLKKVPKHDPRAVIWYENGVVIDGSRDTLRGPPDISKTFEINDPLLHNQRIIAARLRPYFPLIRAVSFAVEGT